MCDKFYFSGFGYLLVVPLALYASYASLASVLLLVFRFSLCVAVLTVLYLVLCSAFVDHLIRYFHMYVYAHTSFGCFTLC